MNLYQAAVQTTWDYTALLDASSSFVLAGLQQIASRQNFTPFLIGLWQPCNFFELEEGEMGVIIVLEVRYRAWSQFLPEEGNLSYLFLEFEPEGGYKSSKCVNIREPTRNFSDHQFTAKEMFANLIL